MNDVTKLVRTELRLVLREPLVLAFVFAFPIVTVLVIAGSFSAEDAPDFGGVEPAQWYVASYLAVVIAAIGLVMVPVHLAAYRERGVLKRFAAAGFSRWSFAIAQLVVGVLLTITASAVLLLVAGLAYGLPPVQALPATLVGVVLGAVAFTSLGLLLGAVVPSARAAQGIGLMAFFPCFLLGGGGPPPSVLSEGMRAVTDFVPLTHVTEAIRDPWLGLGSGLPHLAALLALVAVSVLGWQRALRL